MVQGLIQKYEINADMGEGFGRWKLVGLESFITRLVRFGLLEQRHRAPMKSS